MSEVPMRQLLPGAVPFKHLPNKEPSSWDDVDLPNNKPTNVGISTQRDESFIKTASRDKKASKIYGNKKDSTESTEESEEEESSGASR